MSSSAHDLPELDELDSGRSIVRLPSEQNVPLTPRVRAILDTVEFQRLAEISQLGFVARVYPGARHTRLEHALGVYHNALRYLRQLRRDRRFQERVDRRGCELLMVAALLHDLGHWPFCHPIEDLALADVPTHEQHAASFLGPGSELAAVLARDWGLSGGDVLEILCGRDAAPPRPLLRSILSGPIDIDKLDYLERDSLHAGVPYGRHFDKQRLIQSLVVNAAGDGLAITAKGKTAAELMVFARYVMFSEVYWHHAVRAATSMFARGFFELRGALNLAEVLRLSEAGLIAELQRVAAGRPEQALFEGVFGPRRTLFKRAAEFSHLNAPEVHARAARRPYADLVRAAQHAAARLAERLGASCPSWAVLIDAPPPHREVEFAVDVYFPKEDCYRPLRTVSPVIEALARNSFDDYVKRVRVYAAPSLAAACRTQGVDQAWWRTALLESLPEL